MTKKELAYKSVIEQNLARPKWCEKDSLDFLQDLFFQEYYEFVDAFKEVQVGADPIVLANEAGDIGYLRHRIHHYTGDNVPVAVEEVYLWAKNTLSDAGMDMDDCVIMKTFRNAIKYPSQPLMSNGATYEEVRDISKQFYSHITDEIFYLGYIEVAHLI